MSFRLTDRVQKLKDARSEAAKEIEAYKAQKQKDYESYEAEVRTCGLYHLHLYNLSVFCHANDDL
jgi:hypothetical protein